MNGSNENLMAEMSKASLARGSQQAKAPDTPLMAQALHRLDRANQNLFDLICSSREAADTIIGSAPEVDGDGARDPSPCGGAMGEVFGQIELLERRIEELHQQQRRLRNFA